MTISLYTYISIAACGYAYTHTNTNTSYTYLRGTVEGLRNHKKIYIAPTNPSFPLGIIALLYTQNTARSDDP